MWLRQVYFWFQSTRVEVTPWLRVLWWASCPQAPLQRVFEHLHARQKTHQNVIAMSSLAWHSFHISGREDHVVVYLQHFRRSWRCPRQHEPRCTDPFVLVLPALLQGRTPRTTLKELVISNTSISFTFQGASGSPGQKQLPSFSTLIQWPCLPCLRTTWWNQTNLIRYTAWKWQVMLIGMPHHR